MRPTLGTIRNCLEGLVPPVITTCADDGVPNCAYLSQAHYIDDDHLALSFQFFNKTRHNVLANRLAQLLVIDPETAAMYTIRLEYLRTEVSGGLFERMRAKLAGIASHTGMSDVFKLLGADIYRVHEIDRVSTGLPVSGPARCGLMARLRQWSDALRGARDLDDLIERTLTGAQTLLGYSHVMLLLSDAATDRLYTVASRGYRASGAGSEVQLGEGVVGVAARERVPIRITHATLEYGYGRAVRASAQAQGFDDALQREIPFPGLPDASSQLAVPIEARGKLLGVLLVESPQDLRFSYDDEDALVTLAAQLGAAMHGLHDDADPTDTPTMPPPRPRTQGPVVLVRHYPVDDSVFLDDDYLIKGVAGAILCKLVRAYLDDGRTDFTNRELRLDPNLGLPDFCDNLEARLILLQRRLDDRNACIRLIKTGRGRMRLLVTRPLSWHPGSESSGS